MNRLVRTGYGTWPEIEAMPEEKRLTLFYASLEWDGARIDWSNGSWEWPKK